MEIKRVGFGLRFEMPNNEDSGEAVDEILGKVISVLRSERVKGLELYGGLAKIDGYDDENIYTLAFTNGGVSRMRKLFAILDSEWKIKGMLSSYRPFIQTNALRNVEGLAFVGRFSDDGAVFFRENEQNMSVGKGSRCRKTGLTVLCAADKFKGSLTSRQAVRCIGEAARKVFENCRVISVPIADGGDGTAETMVNAFNGVHRNVNVNDPYGRRIEASYGIINGSTAIIEMAKASGLALCSEYELDPLHASSVGTGELIVHALNEGTKRILIGIGGSATNDGGMGAARTLGVRFLDEDGNELEGCGENMLKVRSIDTSALHSGIRKSQIKVLCDVRNKLTGEAGATYVFGPQKGANGEMLEILENGMKNLGKLYDKISGKSVSKMPGSGAAGGMGAMLAALLGAELCSGSEAVLEAVDFDSLLLEADVVVTGEGRFDSSSVESGKAVGEVLYRAGAAGKPAFVLAGELGDGKEKAVVADMTAVSACVCRPMELSFAMENAETLLFEAAERLFESINVSMHIGKRK